MHQFTSWVKVCPQKTFCKKIVTIAPTDLQKHNVVIKICKQKTKELSLSINLFAVNILSQTFSVWNRLNAKKSQLEEVSLCSQILFTVFRTTCIQANTFSTEASRNSHAHCSPIAPAAVHTGKNGLPTLKRVSNPQ